MTESTFPERDEFSGASIAIVGGHLGVGPAVVQAFASRGAKLVVGEIAGHAPTEAQRAACALASVTVLPVELSGGDAASAFLDACESQLGPVQVVVMVPPPVSSAPALKITEAHYRSTVERELLGPMMLMLEAARRMADRQYGRIITFGSMSGKTGSHKGVAPFAAAKGGLYAFARALASDIASTGVTVNSIATALFDVQVAAGSEHMNEVIKGIPVGRVGRSSEAAHAALYLASREAGYVTGETLNLSGGRFMD
jgi:3-oxoacyl-[acyl-carrier protein] reductase